MVWKPPPLGFPVSAIANAHTHTPTPVLHTSALLLGTASTDFLFRFAIARMQEREQESKISVESFLLYFTCPPLPLPLKGYEEVSIESAGDRGPRGARERR